MNYPDGQFCLKQDQILNYSEHLEIYSVIFKFKLFFFEK